MRKAIAGVLALPVIASLYLAPLARRPALARTSIGLIALALLSVSVGSAGPRTVTAHKTAPADPAAAARMATVVATGYGLEQPLTIDFRTPMDAASVAAALDVRPAVEVTLAWSADGRSLQVRPAATWRPATFYTVTVGADARDARGRALGESLAATFFTRSLPSATLRLTQAAGRRASVGSGVEIIFDRPVDAASVRAAFSVTPAVEGSFVGLGPRSGATARRFEWRPSSALRADTRYVFSLAPTVVDESGLTLPEAQRLVTRTVAAPAVVRHRPFKGAQQVPREANVSIRFTRPMDRAATQRAFAVAGLDAAKDGRFSWFEGDTVLVFDPREPLDYGAAYVVTLSGDARSADGLSLGSAGATVLRYAFRVESKPAAPAPKPAAPDPTPTPKPTTGGTTSAPWLSVEQYYLRLMNCTRTGGHVTSTGSCIGYGSGRYSAYRPPLKLSSGISTKVARPYAKYLATHGACNHFIGGDPGDRLRRAGYTSYQWAENLGCRSGNPYSAVLGSHLYFQSEESYNGGHWRNMKDPDFTQVGIGVWVANGNVRLVVDFYDP